MRYELAILDQPPTAIFAGTGSFLNEKLEWLQPVDRWTLFYYLHTNAVTINTQTYGVQVGDLAIIPPGAACAHARVGMDCVFDSFTFNLPATTGAKVAVPHVVRDVTYIYADYRLAVTRVLDFRMATIAFAWNFMWIVSKSASMFRGEEALYEAEAFIRQNLGQKFSLADVAASCGRSERQLLRAFRQEYGLTYQEFVQRLKSQEATRLLLTSDLSVKEISLRLGFHDLQHFNKFVRLTTGMSPRAYRELGA